MKHERQALVLSYVHSNLLMRNLDIAITEARIDKDPNYKKLADELKLLRGRVQKTFVMINKNMEKNGINMDELENELDEIHDKSWVAPD